MELADFCRDFEDEILEEAKNPSDGSDGGSGEDFKENAFTRIVIRDLEDAGALASQNPCHYTGIYKRYEFKVSAYAISEEEQRLDLVVADYRHPMTGDPARLNAEDLSRGFKMAERFLSFLLDPNATGPDPSQKSHSMIHEISACKSEFKNVQISLITNGVIAIRKEKQRRKQLLGYEITHEVWDLERLRRFRAGGSSHESIEVDLSAYPGGGLACLSNADPLAGYSTTVAVVPGAVLADWYDEYGARLLELNVRSYLQAKGKINQGILTTLVKEPERFLAYNNGITIVAEDIEFTLDQSRIQKIVGLQIVNGGQTTASIHRARKEHKADLSRVYVQAKLTKVPPDQFETVVPEISRLSNTQNKVSEVDLRARHSFHVGLEQEANTRWVPGEKSKWFYERARGGYQTERARLGGAKKAKFDQDFPSSQKLTKEDIARYVNSYEGLPYLVSLGGQKNFVKFMKGIEDNGKGWKPSAEEYRGLIGKAILYRGILALVKAAKVTAFPLHITNYVVALLSYKTNQTINFERIWDQQAISPELASQVRGWIPGVAAIHTKEAVGKNPSTLFQKETFWLALKGNSQSWKLTDKFNLELCKDADTTHSDDEVDNISECKNRDANEWFQIYRWADESSQVSSLQVAITRRMVELASEKWKRSPNASQASDCMKIIEMYNNRS